MGNQYDEDFYGWTQAQAFALRNYQLGGLDVEHLAEEIEELGQSQRYAIESHLETLLLHLLKYRYDPAQEPRRGWRLTIRNARREIRKRAVGSLQHHHEEYLGTAYAHAVEDAPDATGLPASTFPETCPWPVSLVLDDGFWPEP